MTVGIKIQYFLFSLTWTQIWLFMGCELWQGVGEGSSFFLETLINQPINSHIQVYVRGKIVSALLSLFLRSCPCFRGSAWFTSLSLLQWLASSHQTSAHLLPSLPILSWSDNYWECGLGVMSRGGGKQPGCSQRSVEQEEQRECQREREGVGGPAVKQARAQKQRLSNFSWSFFENLF